MVNLWELREELAVGGPSEANNNDSLFGERIIKDQKPELSIKNKIQQTRHLLIPSNPFPSKNSEPHPLLNCLLALWNQS